MDTTEALEKALDDLNSDRYLGVWSIDLLKNLNALGFDIVAIPEPTIPAAGFGHASDCAVNNAPALPVGACDCGFENDRPTYDELVEAVRRLAELTPATANAKTARDLYLTVKAIADDILDRLK